MHLKLVPLALIKALKTNLFCSMALSKDNLARKQEAVRKYFKKLSDTKELGVTKYTTTYCLEKTADRFFLSPATVQRYVYSGDNKLL